MDELNELTDLMIGLESKANLQLPDPNLRQQYLDDKDRIFWLNDTIGDTTLEINKAIIRCNREDKGKSVEERKAITLMIDSPGGSVEVESSLIGTMKSSKTPVRTICYCTAYSAAADILASGHEGMRFALPFCHIMMHSGSCTYSGTQAQVEAAKKYFDSVNKKVTDYIMSRTKIDKKTANKMKDDYFMTSEDALKLGIIDKIITDLDEVFD